MFPTFGNPSANIVVIMDAPFGADVQHNRLLAAAVHNPIPLTLHKHGVGIHECYITTVLARPLPQLGGTLLYDNHLTTVKKTGAEKGFIPVEGGFVTQALLERRSQLLSLIDSIGPAVVLVMGELSLWTVTGKWNALQQRGSILPSVESPGGRIYKCVATISTPYLNIVPELRKFFERDLRRVVVESQRPGGFKWPEWRFLVQASSEEYMDKLDGLLSLLSRGPLELSCDIETIRRQVACIGLAWSPLDALCVPLRTSREYWTVEQELALVQKLGQILEHPNARIIGQNFHYDAQYITTKWGIVPRCTDDTMVASHILSPAQEKSLDKIASLHCNFYAFWKDELDDYKSAPKDDNKFFSYNCRDCCYTWEAMQSLRLLLDIKPGINALYRERMDRFWYTLLRMTLRGIRVNAAGRGKLAEELMDAAQQRQNFLDEVIGRPFNPRSPVQMKQFFYEEMNVKPEKSRTSKKDSLNAENLIKIPDQRPLLHPLVDAIVEMRSLGVFLKTFALAPLDYDQRIRSFFAMAGTDTFRLASRENAFGTGANLQNIPKGDRARTTLKMPNIREYFLPDHNMELFDIDLAGADAQVVAWEANDDILKELFRKGLKVHAINAKDLFGADAGPDGKREPYYTRTKMGVHLTNYGGYPPTMAKALGITVHEAEKFQKRWFDIHPGIRDWHNRTESNLQSTRTVSNRFGYTYTFLGRIDRALPQALAWGPQSTVAIVTAKAMDVIDLQFPSVEILIQVHDSIVFQVPIRRDPTLVDSVIAASRISIPYDDPLIIPFGVKSSTTNWGECG